MFKKTLLTTALLMSLGITTYSQAMYFPTTDPTKIARQTYDNLMKTMENQIKKVMGETEMDTMANDTEKKIDAFNNAAANAIARLNQAKADIQNKTQEEREQAAPESCSTALVNVSLEDSLCTEQSIVSQIDETRAKFYSAVSGYADALTEQDHQIGNFSLAASSSSQSNANNAAKKAVEEFEKATITEFDKLEAHKAAGRQDIVNNPELYLITDSSPLTFTDEELDIAKSRAFLEYRPYVNMSGEAPTTDRTRVIERSKVVTQEMAAQVINKDIALKTPVQPGYPSRLGALQIAAKVRLMPDGSFDKSEESYMQKMMLKNPGEGATTREEMLIRSIQLSEALDKYKQSLALERQLLLIAANKLNLSVK